MFAFPLELKDFHVLYDIPALLISKNICYIWYTFSLNLGEYVYILEAFTRGLIHTTHSKYCNITNLNLSRLRNIFTSSQNYYQLKGWSIFNRRYIKCFIQFITLIIFLTSINYVINNNLVKKVDKWKRLTPSTELPFKAIVMHTTHYIITQYSVPECALQNYTCFSFIKKWPSCTWFLN